MPTVRKIMTEEEKLDSLLLPTGYTKEQVKNWMDNNIDTDGMTFDEIRTALSKTVEEFPDGWLHQLFMFYDDTFEVITD